MYEWTIVFQPLCKELWCSHITVYHGLSFGLLAEGSSFHQSTRPTTCCTVFQENTTSQAGGGKIPTASFLQPSAAQFCFLQFVSQINPTAQPAANTPQECGLEILRGPNQDSDQAPQKRSRLHTNTSWSPSQSPSSARMTCTVMPNLMLISCLPHANT